MSDVHTQEQGPSVDNASQQYPLGQAFEAYERRYRHLGYVEFENSSRRMEWRHRLDNFRQHFDRLQNSIELLLQPSTSTIDSNASPKKPRARRKKLQSAVKLDLEALEKQLLALDGITEELRSNDQMQEDAERSFDNAVQTISTQLRQSKLIPEDETAPEVCLAPTVGSMSEHPSNISPPIAAELEAYYAAVSTLRNMGERIGELQSEQQEQWERRGVMEDQGQVLDQSEDDFTRTWNDTLEIAYKDFIAAQAAVERTRQDCDAMNISIPTWAEVNSVGEKEDPSSDDVPDRGMASLPNSVPGDSQPGRQQGFALVFNQPLLRGGESPLETPLHAPFSKDRVARWIETTGPTLEPQHPDSLQSTPGAFREDSPSALEPQDIALPPPTEHQWNTAVPASARSENAAVATAACDITFGALATAPRTPSLGAEQGLVVDGNLLRAASRETT
jgi:hypothetical protein